MGTNNCSTVGDRLRAERERLGYSQSDFGGLGGQGKTTQINYEKGGTSPTTDYLLALAPHGVDVVYVLTGKRGIDTVGLLNAEEAALVDNYRHATEAGRAAARSVLHAVQKPSPAARRRAAGGESD